MASFNVENLFPVGESNDGHTITQAEYDERVRTIVLAVRNFLKEPDVIAVQEVAVITTARTRSPAWRRRSATTRATSPPTTTAAASRPASWSRTARPPPTARVIGDDVVGPWANAGVCDLYPGKLFDRAPYALELKKGDLSASPP